MPFESLTLMPFCFEKSRKWIFNVLETFSAWYMLKSGKICKNNDHTCCFIALTLARSLGGCLNTWPNGLVFELLTASSGPGNC